jgi:hypothetical protein
LSIVRRGLSEAVAPSQIIVSGGAAGAAHNIVSNKLCSASVLLLRVAAACAHERSMERACGSGEIPIGMGSMMQWIASPHVKARTTGAVYFLYFAMAILGGVLTPGTASDILAHEALFRWGFAISLVSLALYVALAALFYNLFKPVNRTLALIAAFFSLMGCAMQAFSSLFELAPFVVTGASQFKSAFNPSQLHGLAQMFVDLSSQTGYIGIVFFALFDLAIGYMIFKSTFLPRVLGVLMAIAGLGWLAFLSPPFANHVLIFLEVPGFLAEFLLMLWLLVRGVNLNRWDEQELMARS